MKLLIPPKTPFAEQTELLNGDPVDHETYEPTVAEKAVAEKVIVKEAKDGEPVNRQEPQPAPPDNEDFELEFDGVLKNKSWACLKLFKNCEDF